MDRAAFHAALRHGDVPTAARYLAQPQTVEAADLAESWLATQPRDVINRASLDLKLRTALIGPLLTANCSDVWFITHQAVVVLTWFTSDAAARDVAAFLLSETVTSRWPVTMRWLLGVLAVWAAKRSDSYLLEMVFESTVFQGICTEEEQQALVRHVADVWATHGAARARGRSDVPNVLLSQGANIAWLEQSDTVGSPNLLRVIARNGGYDVGYDGLFRSSVWTQTACECGQTLVDIGADPRARGRFRWRRSLQLDLFALATMAVEDWCVDVDDRVDETAQRSPLMTVAMLPDEFTALLLRNGADVSLSDASGRTALSIAAQSGSLSVVDLLLKYGADPNHVDHAGRSVLDYARQRSRWRDVVDLLVRHGADETSHK